jgi:hypothetical protein
MPIIVPGPITVPDFTVIAQPGNRIRTHPRTVEQAAGEDITWGIDMTRIIGQAAADRATATLTDHTTHTTIDLADEPTVAPGLIVQRIAAGALTAGRAYRLNIGFGPPGTATTLELELAVNCPN